jgi:hypothetical protein
MSVPRGASLVGLPRTLSGGPVDADRIDECLVVSLMLAGRDHSRLAVSLRDKFRRPHVGHPNLDRPKPLRAQPLAVFAYPLPCASHKLTLHVTTTVGQPAPVPQSRATGRPGHSAR